ncbi:alpha/beta hydrolase fold domain-containing protein [Streptomyces sp. R-07]|uniref:alpha/beta hydrolase fold domain-containing protein n=1 Tax=Streptomyces sp. R-07 TaxID=3404052 RepID=UPI003CF711CC
MRVRPHSRDCRRALVVTAEADVAGDEAEEYADRLLRAGVAAIAARFQGTVHDFVSLTALRNSPSSTSRVTDDDDGGWFETGISCCSDALQGASARP